MKRCTKCGWEQPEENFGNKARNLDGLDSWCMSCRNASARGWYSRNRERTRKWQMENAEKVANLKCRWAAEHPGRVREIMKSFHQRHPEHSALLGERAFVAFVIRPIILERDAYTCQLCSHPATVIHHIVPVRVAPEMARLAFNLVSLCSECHRRAHGGSYHSIDTHLQKILRIKTALREMLSPTQLPDFYAPE